MEAIREPAGKVVHFVFCYGNIEPVARSGYHHATDRSKNKAAKFQLKLRLLGWMVKGLAVLKKAEPSPIGSVRKEKYQWFLVGRSATNLRNMQQPETRNERLPEINEQAGEKQGNMPMDQ